MPRDDLLTRSDEPGSLPPRLGGGHPARWGLVPLVLATSLALGLAVSWWLVPAYLALMGWLLRPVAGERAHTATSTEVGSPTESRAFEVTGEDAPTVEPEPDGIGSGAPGTVPEPTASQTATAAPPKRRRGGRRGSKKEKAGSEPRPARWVQVGPGKYVRVEEPEGVSESSDEVASENTAAPAPVDDPAGPPPTDDGPLDDRFPDEPGEASDLTDPAPHPNPEPDTQHEWPDSDPPAREPDAPEDPRPFIGPGAAPEPVAVTLDPPETETPGEEPAPVVHATVLEPADSAGDPGEPTAPDTESPGSALFVGPAVRTDPEAPQEDLSAQGSLPGEAIQAIPNETAEPAALPGPEFESDGDDTPIDPPTWEHRPAEVPDASEVGSDEQTARLPDAEATEPGVAPGLVAGVEEDRWLRVEPDAAPTPSRPPGEVPDREADAPACCPPPRSQPVPASTPGRVVRPVGRVVRRSRTGRQASPRVRRSVTPPRCRHRRGRRRTRNAPPRAPPVWPLNQNTLRFRA